MNKKIFTKEEDEQGRSVSATELVELRNKQYDANWDAFMIGEEEDDELNEDADYATDCYEDAVFRFTQALQEQTLGAKCDARQKIQDADAASGRYSNEALEDTKLAALKITAAQKIVERFGYRHDRSPITSEMLAGK